MIDYSELDREVLNAIRDGNTRAERILNRVHIMCRQLCPDRETERVLDGRLQYLRKAGKIEFIKGHWRTA